MPKKNAYQANVAAPSAAENGKQLVTKRAIAEGASVSVRTVDSWMRQRRIPFVRLSTVRPGKGHGGAGEIHDQFRGLKENRRASRQQRCELELAATMRGSVWRISANVRRNRSAEYRTFAPVDRRGGVSAMQPKQRWKRPDRARVAANHTRRYEAGPHRAMRAIRIPHRRFARRPIAAACASWTAIAPTSRRRCLRSILGWVAR